MVRFRGMFDSKKSLFMPLFINCVAVRQNTR
jgi:hypothetical protein